MGQNPNTQSCRPGKQTQPARRAQEAFHSQVFSSFIKCSDLQFLYTTGSELLTINDFLFKAQVDNINLFKVLHWLSIIYLYTIIFMIIYLLFLISVYFYIIFLFFSFCFFLFIFFIILIIFI